jgi:hypothetical protein
VSERRDEIAQNEKEIARIMFSMAQEDNEDVKPDAPIPVEERARQERAVLAVVHTASRLNPSSKEELDDAADEEIKILQKLCSQVLLSTWPNFRRQTMQALENVQYHLRMQE